MNDKSFDENNLLYVRKTYEVEVTEKARKIFEDNTVQTTLDETNKQLDELIAEMNDKLGFVTQKMVGKNGIEEYVKDVLYRENIEATAIGNGIAIPHGKPEHVIQPKISVVRLRSPIDWGEGRKVDTIFLLALQFDNIASTKAFFYDFTRILSTQENLDRIKSAEDAKSLEIIIKN